MRKYLPFLFAVASIALGFGVDISGIVSLPVAIILWSFGGLILAIYVIYWLKSRITQMVEQEDIESTDVYPSTLDDIRWIANEEILAYKKVYDRMPMELLKQWYIKNPKSFWIIKDGGGERIGNLYMLPIKPKTMEKLISGEIMEKELIDSDLYSPRQADSIKTLHVSSIVCRSNSKGASICLKSLPRIVRSLCDPFKLEYIYALGASQQGLNLLHRNGFTEISSARSRKDRHPLYSIRFQDLVRNIANRLSESEREEFDRILSQIKAT